MVRLIRQLRRNTTICEYAVAVLAGLLAISWVNATDASNVSWTDVFGVAHSAFTGLVGFL